MGVLSELSVGGRAYRWTEWVPLDQALAEPVLPADPGLYRVRRAGTREVVYIGQTGVGIRARVRMLRGIAGGEMPYRDPHTAAPALWALVQSTGCVFEVAGLPVGGDARWRNGLEAVAIALHRQHAGKSPAANFGRMPTGYVMSSGNHARLVAAGKRFRGGVAAKSNASHAPGVPPAGPLVGDPQGPGWCGHAWGAWATAADVSATLGLGLYRIRGAGGGLVYVGEGAIRARVRAHARNGAADPQLKTRQGRIFAEAAPLEYSAIEGPWLSHQRLELETDLIAAHVLELGRAPPAQFIGQGAGGISPRAPVIPWRLRVRRGHSSSAVARSAQH
jgi:hypothetical protein